MTHAELIAKVREWRDRLDSLPMPYHEEEYLGDIAAEMTAALADDANDEALDVSIGAMVDAIFEPIEREQERMRDSLRGLSTSMKLHAASTEANQC